ncbi:MAG: TonB-dependent receptor [Bacteroidota bacterium]
MKQLYNIILFTIFIFFINNSIFCQKKDEIITITGKVIDEKTKEILFGASVTFTEINKTVRTNELGYFQIKAPKGNYNLKVSYSGFKKAIFPIQVSKATEIFVLEMPEEFKELQEVEVKTTLMDNNISDVKMGVTKLNIKTLKKLPAFMGEVDVIRSIMLLPGISTVGEGATGFNVRGGNIDQNLVLMDEAPIFNSSHLMGLFSVFNPDAVKELSLYRGGIPAQYGGRASSVLDIKLKDANAQKFGVQGGIGIVASRLIIEAPLIKDKLSFFVAGRGSFSDFLFNYSPNKNISDTKANFYDITTKFEAKISQKDRLFFTGYRGKDVFKLASDSLSVSEINSSSTIFNWQTTSGTLKYNHFFNKSFSSNLSVISSLYEANIINPEGTNAFKLNSGVHYNSVKLDFFLEIPHNKIDFGAAAVKYTISPGSLNPTAKAPELNGVYLQKENGLELAGFINDEIEFGKNITFMAGIRYSNFTAKGPADVAQYQGNIPKDTLLITGYKSYTKGEKIASFGGLEPRLALRIGLSKNTSIKLSYNKMRQYIQMISNTTAALPTARWKISDAYIKPQISDQISMGIFKNFKDDTYEFSGEVYYKIIDNITDYKDGANLLLQKTPETSMIQGTGRAYGAELMIKKNTGYFTGWASYTYSQILLLMSRDASQTINNGFEYPSNYNKPHSLNVVTIYQVNKRKNVSLNYTFSEGRPITYPVDKYFVGGVYVPNYINRNQNKIPNYSRVDFAYTIEPNEQTKKHWKHSWVFNVYNLLSKRNAYSIFFKTKNSSVIQFYNRAKTYRLSVFGSAIPSITYNFKF